MSRLLPLLFCVILFAGCSHRPSPELRRMLRQFATTADAAIGATDAQTLRLQLDSLGVQWPELIRALPGKDWHRPEFSKLAMMLGKLHDAHSAWGSAESPGPETKRALSEAGEFYHSAFDVLDAEMRE